MFTTLVAPSREEALEIAEKYRQPATFERESSLAWTQAQVQLHHLRITQDEAHLFQRLANRLLYADPTVRAAPSVARDQSQRRVGALALRHLRRPSHRAGSHRAGRGAGRRATAPAGARVLAHEGDCGRSGDSQRHRSLLRPGAPGIPRGNGASEPGGGRGAQGNNTEACFCCAPTSCLARDQILLRAAARIVISAHRARSPSRRFGWGGPDPGRSRRASARPRETAEAVPLPPWIWSSETASADSRRADASTSRFWARGSGPRLPGSTWWRTRSSVSRSRSRARAPRGP